MNFKIATAQYDISFLENWQQYQDKAERWVVEAARQDAKILLFPEYASMELASLFIARDGVYAGILPGAGSAVTASKRCSLRASACSIFHICIWRSA